MSDRRDFMGKEVLITGGLGFIGSNLACYLYQQGARVTIVDSLISECGGNVYNIAGLDGVLRVNISDVRDPYSFRALIGNVQYLFNLAGKTSHVDSMRDPLTDLDINCKAQLSILEACKDANRSLRIVFASTRQLYGRPLYLPVDEKHPTRPIDINGINKLAGEGFHLLYNEVYGIKTTVLRFTNVYGPRMRIKDARQTFLGVWIRSVLQGTPFEVWGGSQKRDLLYVDDAVSALIAAATSEKTIGCVFNIGAPEVVTLSQLAELLLKAAGRGSFSVCEFPADRRQIDIGDYYTAFGAMTDATGWRPHMELSCGLEKTVQYFSECLDFYL